jgi:hypothetical protein
MIGMAVLMAAGAEALQYNAMRGILHNPNVINAMRRITFTAGARACGFQKETNVMRITICTDAQRAVGTRH